MKAVLFAMCCSLLIAPLLSAQGVHLHQTKRNCDQAPEPLNDAVAHEIWARGEGDVATARGFIRIAVHPRWDAESFVSVRLNKIGTSTVTVYSLPTKTKYLVELIRAELKNNPCATAKQIASKLPLKSETLSANKELQSVIDELMSLRFAARPLADSVRMDATEYDVEFYGEDTMRISTDDWETPVVQWVQSLQVAIANQKQQDGRR